jgi:hypothetical protein
MTNRSMVTPEAARGEAGAPRPNTDPLPPMPSPEGAPGPVTDREPVDSPHLNEEMQPSREGGLTREKRL